MQKKLLFRIDWYGEKHLPYISYVSSDDLESAITILKKYYHSNIVQIDRAVTAIDGHAIIIES